jgi:hypothetical protein
MNVKYNQVLYTVEVEGKGLLAVEELCSKRSRFTGYTDTLAEAVLYQDKLIAVDIINEINNDIEEENYAILREVYVRIE